MSETVVGISIDTLHWFECEGSFFAIDRTASALLNELALADVDISAVADLVDMVLLDEVDNLLSCLDDWAGHTFDWTPMTPVVDDSENENSSAGQVLPFHELHGFPKFTARISSLEDNSQTLLLALDLAMLDALPPFPASWESLVKFDRYLKPMKLQLQQISLLDKEHSKLSTGAMVLLPQSFAPQWQAMLVTTDEYSWNIDAPGSIVVDTDENQVRILPPVVPSTEEPADKPDAPVLTIELEGLLNVNELYTESVWRVQQNMVISLPQAIEGARVVIRAKPLDNSTNALQRDESDDSTSEFKRDESNDSTSELQRDQSDDDLAWSGTLMKVGQGYGVVLEA